MKGRFTLYDDKQKEKLEEWDLMFVKAQPGVAKVKRKDSKGALTSKAEHRPRNEAENPHGDGDGLEISMAGVRQRSASLTSSHSNNSTTSVPSTTPPSSGRSRSPRQELDSPTSSSSSIKAIPEPPYTPSRSSSPKSSSRSLHFFELMTREETIRFLSPSERENEEWVEVINRERDTLVTCMLLAGDEDGSDKVPENGDEGEKNGDGKLSIDESRRMLREIMESESDAEDGKEKEITGTVCENDSSNNKQQEPHRRSLRWSSNMHCADCGEGHPGTIFDVLPLNCSG